MTKVVLVDEHDREVGYVDKWLAHQQGLLHRAFSIFIFAKQAGRINLLLQQRKTNKYHSGGLWSNTCCSHPLPNEDIIAAGKRRLQQEMGFVTDLQPIGQFCYYAPVGNNLIEHELDHVLIGFYSEQAIKFNPEEVAAYDWIDIAKLIAELNTNPSIYTYWLKPALALILQANILD